MTYFNSACFKGLCYSIFCLILFSIPTNSLMPMPKTYIRGTQTIKIVRNCAMQFVNGAQFPDHIIQLLQHYHSLIVEQSCEFEETLFYDYQNFDGVLKFYINLQSQEQLYWVNDTSQEAYQLTIDEKLNILIEAPNHWALARALDTVNQLIEKNQIENLPLYISDEPAFSYRGVMVDSARHYLPMKTLERTIDALVINKMNVMHWHISDDESFPLLLSNLSIITNTSKFQDSAYYSKLDVSHLIEYASIRGVQIIPEIDTPAHVSSWGRGIPDFEQIILNCGCTYGQFDPTLDLTYEIVEQVLKDLSEMFSKVQFVHFGGDETNNECYDQKPSIKEFMNQHGIADYFELQAFYRKKQKQIWKKLNQNKRIAYWYNGDDQLPAENDDIIHWWGLTSELEDLKYRTNDFILSDYHPLYLDLGMGNAYGDDYESYQTWKDFYKWSPKVPEGFKGRILGAEAPLWGETNNENTHFQKLFMRSSILGDILWNPNSKQNEQFYDFVERLGQMEDRMNKYGFPVSPFTHDYCKKHVRICFPILYGDENAKKDNFK